MLHHLQAAQAANLLAIHITVYSLHYNFETSAKLLTESGTVLKTANL